MVVRAAATAAADDGGTDGDDDDATDDRVDTDRRLLPLAFSAHMHSPASHSSDRQRSMAMIWRAMSWSRIAVS